ncbi:MAG: type II toxin-antitoxin system VapB family antitoxin [Methylobacterium mesophilicum]|nr:type II toxin-antitoxin system VapB family antitoxin [Methylobacterium mesophilicum]
MAFDIRDEETLVLIRELAAKRGINLEEAVRVAVENELLSGKPERRPGKRS